MKSTLALLLSLAAAPQVLAATAVEAPAKVAGDEKRLPTVFLIGDSTVQVGTRGQQGWGTPLAAYFDATKIAIVNRARGGRSSRTFRTEGLWEAVRTQLKPGDWVLMQFGHNDGAGPFDEKSRARGTLRGKGDETVEGLNPNTKQQEVVYTYGWYLRRYVREAKAAGARPVVVSPIPRNRWDEAGKVERASSGYGLWAREVATEEGALFVDLNEIVARRYEALGKPEVDTLFGGDWTHTNLLGASLNAESVVSGLKALGEATAELSAALTEKGAAVAASATGG